jgi:hypothetical protein
MSYKSLLSKSLRLNLMQARTSFQGFQLFFVASYFPV